MKQIIEKFPASHSIRTLHPDIRSIFSAAIPDSQLIKGGKNPFILDSKEPQGDFREFLRGEVRFSSLERTFPEAADALFERTESEAKARYARYKELAEKN